MDGKRSQGGFLGKIRPPTGCIIDEGRDYVLYVYMLRPITLEEDFSTISIAIPSHTRLQDTSLAQVLNKTIDHPVATLRRQDVHSHREVLFVKGYIREVACGANCMDVSSVTEKRDQSGLTW